MWIKRLKLLDLFICMAIFCSPSLKADQNLTVPLEIHYSPMEREPEEIKARGIFDPGRPSEMRFEFQVPDSEPADFDVPPDGHPRSLEGELAKIIYRFVTGNEDLAVRGRGRDIKRAIYVKPDSDLGRDLAGSGISVITLTVSEREPAPDEVKAYFESPDGLAMIEQHDGFERALEAYRASKPIVYEIGIHARTVHYANTIGEDAKIEVAIHTDNPVDVRKMTTWEEYVAMDNTVRSKRLYLVNIHLPEGSATLDVPLVEVSEGTNTEKVLSPTTELIRAAEQIRDGETEVEVRTLRLNPFTLGWILTDPYIAAYEEHNEYQRKVRPGKPPRFTPEKLAEDAHSARQVIAYRLDQALEGSDRVRLSREELMGLDCPAVYSLLSGQ